MKSAFAVPFIAIAIWSPPFNQDLLKTIVFNSIFAAMWYFSAAMFRKAAAAVRSAWVLGNEYLQFAAPWTALKTDRDQAAVGVRTGLNLVALFARLAAPILTASAPKIAASVSSGGSLVEG